jgi:excinuclease UvrABC nuclease subunit
MTTVEFKSLDIAAFVPNKAGVYIIMNSLKKAIYVGQSATLKNRLLEHAGRTSEQSECIIREFPTEIYYNLIADEGERLKAEQELIRDLQPICSGEVRR